ncbi:MULTISPECIES: FMN-binding negative transcriptional regulator [Rhodanobacter]|uniref:FMN-binding negative transcriptional regulator n=1 Tax=Rhodanobacter TaxID=75309 RepID=UPI0004190F3D|nr:MULTISPECIES: FMN-binding negative transcriptional regulator [Rhodanobacter]KZC18923.1 transcriptional regulator [Rhodanobacter denitrificans]UJJ52257.1 FMN-binding negative transcriptional regulator [Rhodanobacter denitrificans]UJM95004.1 FMN-binding negative transcriptional regulator [Rhodanobacter denitrificans]UJM98535.1 FMN-binding negative transcriptional regulator [Rhodanobacter denitrificans]UJN22051.1 FMN-binding negative transcriptional regulator [Rhodanobacter denitrificans]
MYTPKHFVESRVEALHGLIRAYPFATLVTRAADGLTANHLPFERVGEVLHGHVARGNELARLDGAEVLLVFQGPDGYISPNWYPSKHETGREVPTWNYAVVHVHGRLRVIDDAAWLRRLLETLTDHHEAGQPQPWKITDAPDDHIEKSLRAIVGLEVVVERIEGKFKLSQNHPARNRAGVIAGLRGRNGGGDAELAAWMTQQEESKP